ncbi:MAG: ribonuclease HI [Solirubrobacteraceae bacterium]
MTVTTELWTDGACSGNPGPGGWAFVLVARARDGTIVKRLEGHGGETNTTNNRMELTAALHGLRALMRPTVITVFPDSAYLTRAFRDGWLEKWQRNGWKSERKPVKNQDLWRGLLDAVTPHTVAWEQVKGHAGRELNERCDQLAVYERDLHAGRIPPGTEPPPA